MGSRSARPDLPATVEVGRVLRPHGVRGELRIAVESDVPDRFAKGRRLEAVVGTQRRTLIVAGFRGAGDGALLRVEGVTDRDEAAALRGAVLEVRREDVPPAPEGVWYTFELVGCRCRDAVAGDLGRVVEVIEDGGGWILEIASERGRLLVPLVDEFLARVDVDTGEIDLRLPDGLIETCASES